MFELEILINHQSTVFSLKTQFWNLNFHRQLYTFFFILSIAFFMNSSIAQILGIQQKTDRVPLWIINLPFFMLRFFFVGTCAAFMQIHCNKSVYRACKPPHECYAFPEMSSQQSCLLLDFFPPSLYNVHIFVLFFLIFFLLNRNNGRKIFSTCVYSVHFSQHIVRIIFFCLFQRVFEFCKKRQYAGSPQTSVYIP